jgi:PDZ domain-containing protein
VPDQGARGPFRLRVSRKTWLAVFLAGVFLGASFWIPLPYYIFQPGTAEATQPIVTVEGGHKSEKGELLLTTVYTIPAENVFYLAYGFLAPHSEILPARRVAGNLNDQQYDRLMLAMMKESQDDAVAAALRALGKPVSVEYDGVQAWDILPGSPADGKLQAGDVIVAVDGKPVYTAPQLIRDLRQRRAGESVTLTLRRGGRLLREDVVLAMVGGTGQAAHPGLGIQPVTLQKVRSPVKVVFHTKGIGGPSAGLMFALQIINQLSDHDITKGYKIAGTGTIDDKGNVGQIGGVEHKVVAADRAGAQVFLVPADIRPDDSNTQKAILEARLIGTKMRIVPVRTLQDALDFLSRLPVSR